MLKPKTKKNLSLAIILIIVVYTLCFGFLSYHKFQEWVLFPFFESMISVFMGAGAIGLITGIILIFQSTIQSAQEKNKEVFDRKLNLYEKIINDMNGYFEDNKIDDDERRNLFFTQLSVALLSKPKTFKSFSDLLKNISDEEGNLNEIAPDKLLDFILEAREDLDVQSEMTEEDKKNFDAALINVREEAVKQTRNMSVEGLNIIDQISVSLNGDEYHLKQYEGGKIRINKNLNEEEEKGTKGILRQIIKQKELEVPIEGFTTQQMGKKVIEKLKQI